MPEIIIHSPFLESNFNGRRVKEKALGQVFNKNRDINLQVSKISGTQGRLITIFTTIGRSSQACNTAT
jgi:hypothetical protein